MMVDPLNDPDLDYKVWVSTFRTSIEENRPLYLDAWDTFSVKPEAATRLKALYQAHGWDDIQTAFNLMMGEFINHMIAERRRKGLN